MTIFCTVNWQNYQGRGAEYVNILFDSVRRNLEAGVPGRFIVFTDDDPAIAGYSEGIETRPLPDNLEGWWNKLALFRPDALPEGERIVYFDLDSVITGPLDALAAYAGPFGILQDFYRPLGLQSSVMAWEAGSAATVAIWDAYQKAGCPQDDPGGDQSFIERCSVKGRERLQIALPGTFVSYKVNGGVIPEKASVVVFHGWPKPSDFDQDGWARR